MRDAAQPVMVIAAPTASGKTALVRALFGKGSLFRFKDRAEIISADSQAVYKGFDIGTAKPTPEEQKEIPYHLIDVAAPFRQFGLGDFMSMAGEAAAEIWSKKKIPVLVGGTGFYIRSFLMGAPVAPESSPKIRSRLFERLEKEGSEKLYEELTSLDPDYAKKIHVNDAYRICRGLEVFYTSGRPLSSYEIPQSLRKGFSFLTIILERDREELYRRIDDRVEELFKNGLEEEVRHLREEGCNAETPAMKAIGYREFFDSELNGDIGLIKAAIKHNSHRYAKRQITYMQNIPEAITLHADSMEKIRGLAEDFFSKWLDGES